MKKVINSPKKMHEFAVEIAHGLSGGEVLGLEGDLGTGKTEFVRGLAEAFDSRDVVKSPSFTLLNHYRLNHPTIKHLIHVDFYRLENASVDIVSQIGLDEWLGKDDSIIVIEWPDRLKNQKFISQHFRFDYGEKENDRTVQTKNEA